MKCWNCGAELKDGQQFCGGCGAQQNTAQTPPPQQGPQTPGNTYSAPGSGANGELILKVFSLILAAVYAINTLRNVGTLFRWLSNMLRGYVNILSLLQGLLFSVLFLVAGALMCISLVLTALKRTPSNSDGLLMCTAGSGILIAALRLVRIPIVFIINLIAFHHPSAGGTFKAFFLSLLGAAVTIGGIYAIRRFLLGENPLVGKSKEQLKEEMQNVFSSAKEAAGEASAAAAAGAAAAQANIRAQQEARQAQQAQQAQYQYQQQQNGAYPPQSTYTGGRVKTDRSLLMYILLTIVTCGIYSWYFIYSIARDVNVLCEGDGKKTGGLLAFILLNLITCGIYSWIWYYSLGNRLAANAPRYGMNFQENGTTVLLWCLLGSLLCGIGPFIAMNILIKNTNSLAIAYNQINGL